MDEAEEKKQADGGIYDAVDAKTIQFVQPIVRFVSERPQSNQPLDEVSIRGNNSNESHSSNGSLD